MVSRKLQLMALAVALGTLRCDSSSEPNLPACASPVAVTATSSLDPSFAWTPNCLVDQVTVFAFVAPSVIPSGRWTTWVITSRVAGSGASSPLEYGAVPAHMEETLSASALTAGVQYHVEVSSGTVVVGQAVFRP